MEEVINGASYKQRKLLINVHNIMTLLNGDGSYEGRCHCWDKSLFTLSSAR